MKVIGYAFVVGDLFHYGHLHFLNECRKYCDFLIVGVYTDELTASYKRKPIIPFSERSDIIRELKQVDLVVTVRERSCVYMLRKLFGLGIRVRYLFHSTDWDPEVDQDLKESKEYIEMMGGELIQPEYYPHQSTTKIIKEVIDRHTKGEDVIGNQN